MTRMDCFYSQLKIHCQQIKEEIEATARHFVRLAGTSGPVLSLACLTLLFLFFFHFIFLLFFFLAVGTLIGFGLSLTEKEEGQ